MSKPAMKPKRPRKKAPAPEQATLAPAREDSRSTYSPETADKICSLIEEGKSIRDICGMEGMPGWTTIRAWLRAHEEFRAAYQVSRVASGEAMEQLILDEMAKAVDNTTAAVSRTRIEALKWLASKRNPAGYGDAVAFVPPPAEDAADRRMARIAELLAIALAKPDVPAAPKPEEKL